MPVTEQKGKSEIVIKSRRDMCVEGAVEVVSFDTEGARLKTVDGELVIEGEDIKIDTLDTDRALVSLNGKINGMYYISDEENRKRGFFGRLAR